MVPIPPLNPCLHFSTLVPSNLPGPYSTSLVPILHPAGTYSPLWYLSSSLVPIHPFLYLSLLPGPYSSSLVSILPLRSLSFLPGPYSSSRVPILPPQSLSFLPGPYPSFIIPILRPWSLSLLPSPPILSPWSLSLLPSLYLSSLVPTPP